MDYKYFQQSRFFFWLVAFVLIKSAENANFKSMTDLRIFDGDNDVTNAVFLNGTNGIEDPVDGTADCPISPNREDLPDEMKGEEVGVPGKILVSIFPTLHDGWYYPGAIVSWKSPYATVSRKHLKGFYVVIEHDGKVRCRVYYVDPTRIVDKSQTAIFPELDFKIQFQYFVVSSDAVDVTVTVYTLPFPSHNQLKNRSILMKIPKRFKKQYPGDWTPSITVDPSLEKHTVDVYFSLPPKFEDEPWNLTHFDVKLSKNCYHRSVWLEKRVIKELNTTDTHGHVQFTGLDKDFYSVTVAVINPEHPRTDSCICKKREKGDNEKFYCSISCDASSTVWFDLEGNQSVIQPNECKPPTTTTSTTTTNVMISNSSTLTSTTDGTTKGDGKVGMSQDEYPKTTNTIIIGVFIAVGVLVVGIIIVILVYCFCRRKKVIYDVGKKPDQAPNKQFQDIKRKTVYIVSAADHKESQDLLNKFCEILRTHCLCDVINPRDSDRSTTIEAAWVTAQIMKSDSLIFINSKGAEKLVDSYLYGKDTELDVDHSLFHNALKISFTGVLKKKVFVVSFNNQDYISSRLAVMNPKKYNLPKNFTPFLRCLHELSENFAENFMSKLPLDSTYHSNLPEWSHFLGAINEVDKFEKNNPEWFDVEYNTSSAKPRSASESSGCSSILPCNVESPGSYGHEPQFSPAPGSPDEGIGMGNKFPEGDDSDSTSIATDLRSFLTLHTNTDADTGIPDDHTSSSPQRSSPVPPQPLKAPDGNGSALRRVIPPRNEFNGDDASLIIGRNNDALSLWSKSPECTVITETEAPEDVERGLSNHSSSAEKQLSVIKLPRTVQHDNASDILRSFNNDEYNEVCYRTVNAVNLDERFDSGLGEMSV